MTAYSAIAFSLMGLGGLVSLLNWFCFYETRRTGHFYSAVPLVGAVFLGGGMLMLPSTRPFYWLAAALDYGTVILISALPRLVDELWKTSRYNLLEEYIGEDGLKSVRLRLYRNGVFTIRQHFRRIAGECGLVSAGDIGNWSREEGRLELATNGDTSAFETLEINGIETLAPASSLGS